MQRLISTTFMILLLIGVINSTGVAAEVGAIGTIEYFYISGCDPCGQQAGILDKWSKENAEKLSRINIEKIDVGVSSAKALSKGYKNQSVPYFQVRNTYGEVIATGQGVQTEKQLSELVDLLFKSSSGIEFTLKKQYYKKNGKEVKISTAPFIQNGRTYVPLRPLANSLGIEDKDINYSKNIITLKKSSGTIEFKIGQQTIKINGVLKEIDAAPILRQNSAYLPAKYLAEALGYTVKWKDGKVIINEPIEKVLSKSIPDPTPVVVEGEDKYYDLAEMLVLGGLSKDDFYFEKEDIIILNNNNTYKGLVLTDAANKIYMVGKDGKYYNYDLGNTLTKKGDKWLVKNDDVLRAGMLGSILKG